MLERRSLARPLAAALCVAAVMTGLAGCSAWRSESQPGSGSTSPAPSAAPSASSKGGYVPPSNGEAAQDNAGVGLSDGAAPGARNSAGSGKTTVVSADRMVIRNANMRLEVKKVADAVASIRRLTAKHGGVVANLQLSTDDGGTPTPLPEDAARSRVLPSGLPFTGSVTVLVPVARFDAFRGEAEKLGRVLSEGSDDQDVTQQHVDLRARLANARAEEARLRTFFEKARTVSEMLSIERELTRVRGDIESMTAQLASLERQAAMATLTIELLEPKAIVRPSNGIDWGFGEALTTGIQGMVDLTKGILVVVIALAPVWLAALAVFLLIRWRIRARRARSTDADAPESA